MTIFDSIRYPISVPIRVEELEALPPALYYKWTALVLDSPRNMTPEMFIMIASATEAAIEALLNEPSVTKSYRGKDAAELLRKMILEWDDK